MMQAIAPHKWMTQAPATADVVNLQFYGNLEASKWGDSDVTLTDLAAALDAKPSAGEIVCRFNSFGGDVFVGIAAYNLLAAHPARKTCIIEGIAASAASVVAMAGRVVMRLGSQMMIHCSWNDRGGNASEHSKMAEEAARVDESLVAIYQAKTGLAPEKIRELMAASTWLDAPTAKALGFADEIQGEVQPQARGTQIWMNNIAFSADRLPERLRAVAAPRRNAMDLMSLIKAALVARGLLKEGEEPTDEQLAALLLPLIQGAAPAPVEPEEPAEPAEPEMAQAKAELTRLLAAIDNSKSVDEACLHYLALKLEADERAAEPRVDPIKMALESGRIKAHEESTLRSMWPNSPGAVRDFINGRQPGQAVPTGPRQSARAPKIEPPREAEEEFTPEDRAMMASTHTSPEAFRAAKAAMTRKLNAALIG